MADILMKRLRNCPFCNEALIPEEYYPSIERCRGKDDHTYIQKILLDINEVYKIKIRVGPGDVRYYLEADELERQTSFWSGRNNSGNKISINKFINIDLSGSIDELIKKIKVYLTFS